MISYNLRIIRKDTVSWHDCLNGAVFDKLLLSSTHETDQYEIFAFVIDVHAWSPVVTSQAYGSYSWIMLNFIDPSIDSSTNFSMHITSRMRYWNWTIFVDSKSPDKTASWVWRDKVLSSYGISIRWTSPSSSWIVNAHSLDLKQILNSLFNSCELHFSNYISLRARKHYLFRANQWDPFSHEQTVIG